MKAQIINTIVIILLTSWSSAHAQSFNTISNTLPRHKVEHIAVTNEKEASPKSDTSDTYQSVPSDTAKSLLSLQNKQEQIRYPLSVSYPLRQSKLHVSSPYGYRIHPILKVRKMHNGVDLRAKREPVYAMLPGTVVKTGFDAISGNFVTLQHASMRISYCHLSVIGVEKGATVYAGQPLGIAGTTGRSTGVHLHLTLKIGNKACNPIALLDFIGKQLAKPNS